MKPIKLILALCFLLIAGSAYAQPYSVNSGSLRGAGILGKRNCASPGTPDDGWYSGYDISGNCIKWFEPSQVSTPVACDIGGDGNDSSQLTKIVITNDTNSICGVSSDILTCDVSKAWPIADSITCSTCGDNKVLCIKSDKTMGTCSDQPDTSGTCTCQ